MKKYVLFGLLFSCLLLFCCENMKVKELDIIKPKRDRIEESFTEPAKTRLAKTWSVTTPIGGRISRISIEPGDQVTSGAIIAKYDLVPFQQSVTEAKAAVLEFQNQIIVNEYDKLEQTALKEILAAIDAAKETLKAADAQIQAEKARSDRATRELNRQEELIRTNAISQSELEDYILEAETTLIELKKQEFVRAALNSVFIAYNLGPQFINEWLGRKTLEREVLIQQLAQAKSRLIRAEHELKLARIVSPINGVVLERYEQGESTLPPGKPLVLLGNLSDLEVVAEILTRDALKIKTGSVVTLKTSSQMETLSGKVKLIEPSGFTKLSSLGVEQQRVNVIISLDRKPENLGIGYRLQVRFVTNTKDDALIVPRFSVLQSPDGSFYVFRIKGDIIEKQTVLLGLKSDLELEIIQGLSEQDFIIATPDSTMKTGDKVKAKP